MTTPNPTGGQMTLDRPPQRRGVAGYVWGLLLIGVLAAAGWAWKSGRAEQWLKSSPGDLLAIDLVEVDEGDITEIVVENGTLESSMSTVVRCEVEALMGTVGGSNSQTGSSRTGAGGTSGTSQGGTSGTTSATSPTSTQTTTAATTKAKSTSSTSKTTGTTSKTSGTTGTTSGSTGTASSSSSSTAASTSLVSGGKPSIRSFSYMVTPYVPLKPTTSKSSTTTTSQSGSMAGGGGRRGGGGGGGGGGMGMDEKPGSTRIVSILSEGTNVKKGDVVCELDASAFHDEMKLQKIRYAQAKAWVDQVHAIYEVNLITLTEFRDGIFPQDLKLINQYIETCRVDKERAERNLVWSREVTNKGLRTHSQLKADELSNQRASIALEEAEGMYDRLANYTGPKILKSLEAKVKAIEADKKNQEVSFELEKQRMARLQKCIDNCTLRAPDDGIVVYAQLTNGWGRVESQIEEGVTVREGQPIFQLPDPKHMKVKTRINETKISRVTSGQPAMIRVDAFPDRPMKGVVSEVTAISTPINGPFSDVRIYFASVNIEQGFSDLRPGLTAEVFFNAETRRNVTRVPIGSIRKFGDKSYVAVQKSEAAGKRASKSWEWKAVELGISDPNYVQVISGVKRGDKIVSNVINLPAIENAPLSSEAAPTSLASTEKASR
jgi:multidrug resistance efflux pump